MKNIKQNILSKNFGAKMVLIPNKCCVPKIVWQNILNPKILRSEEIFIKNKHKICA